MIEKYTLLILKQIFSNPRKRLNRWEQEWDIFYGSFKITLK